MSTQLRPIDYVMFGHSALFGDYVDIVHACGGRLKKVVVNVADTPRASDGRTFADDLAAMNDVLAGRPDGYEIAVEPVDRFRPVRGESYVVGFRGVQLSPLRDRLKSDFGLEFRSLLHPTAAISATAHVGEGAIVNAGGIVGSFARLGEFCLVNRGATIGYGATVEAFANIGPGANLAGRVGVGRGAAVGIGATILNGVTVGDGAVVAAGALVNRDVAPHTLVAGSPARRVPRRK